jgi:hypothetical protein
LQFCGSRVPTERLNDCLDAASRDCFCLMFWNTVAHARQRVTTGCLYRCVSSMRAKRSSRGLDSSCGCSSQARTAPTGYDEQRAAAVALDFAVRRVRRQRSDDRSRGVGSELSVLGVTPK